MTAAHIVHSKKSLFIGLNTWKNPSHYELSDGYCFLIQYLEIAEGLGIMSDVRCVTALSNHPSGPCQILVPCIMTMT